MGFRNDWALNFVVLIPEGSKILVPFDKKKVNFKNSMKGKV